VLKICEPLNPRVIPACRRTPLRATPPFWPAPPANRKSSASTGLSRASVDTSPSVLIWISTGAE
jgi:hypothetical protein